MASALTSPKVGLSLTCNLTGGVAPAIASCPVNHTISPTIAASSAAGGADLVYATAGTVTSGTPVVIDLTTGLTDPLGVALVFAHVVAIMVTNDSTTVGQTLTVGGGTNPILASESDPVQANGGGFVVVAPNPGFTVDSTHKTLQVLVAAGTSVPYKLTVLGRSA